jgi:hypothetical protein
MERCRFLGALFLLMVGGCSRESPPAPVATAPPAAATATAPLTLEQARTRAQDIDARRAGWRSVPGTLQAGEATSRFVALYDSGVLRLIEERSDAGVAGGSIARYYLDATATLFLFDAREEGAAAGAAPGGAREVVKTSMVFEPDGRMVASQKYVDARMQPLLKEEIDSVVQRLAALRAAAPRL